MAEKPTSRTRDAEEFLSESEVLADGNYRIEKHRKPTVVEGKTYDQDGHQFAVLKYKNRVVANYDRLIHPLGTGTRFGFYSLIKLGGNQLIVEQTENRGWQYWVIDLNQKTKVIYDSGQYGVGEILRVVDIDGDGREELVQSLITFWFFDHLANSNSPLIDIVFAYDKRSKEYVPANHRFQDFVLQNMEQDIAMVKASELKLNTGYQESTLSAILKVMLEYIYAGQEKEAWDFYEAEYNLPDKTEMKVRIKDKLTQDSIYRALSKSSSRADK